MGAHPGGSGPALTGTLGVTAGVMLLVGCLVAAAPEFLSEPDDGLESGADVVAVRTGVAGTD